MEKVRRRVLGVEGGARGFGGIVATAVVDALLHRRHHDCDVVELAAAVCVCFTH